MSGKVSRTHTPLDPADANVMDLFRMDGMVAVVTGAGRGIGRGISLAFADAGATVVLTARREHELDEVAERIAQRGGKSLKIVADITAPETIPNIVDRAMNELGSVDTWVSNAGTSDYPGNFAFQDFPDWHWDNQLALNLRPHFIAARECSKVMKPGSTLIGISSIASLRPAVNFAAYGAAKSGMNSLSLTLATELGGKGIRSNVISPGTVPTEATKTVGHVTDAMLEATASRTPIRRNGTPTDCGAAAVWLASPAGSWITGQNIVVSGGL